MEYKTHWVEIVDHKVNLPNGAIPLKMGLMLTKPFSDPDCKMRDGVCCLVPITRDEKFKEEEK